MPATEYWMLFKALLPGWRDAYMERLNRQYIAILTSNRSAHDKFWAIEKHIQRDRKSPGVILEMSRSKMEQNLIALINDKVIALDDLKDFSDELQEKIASLIDFE